MEALQGLYFQAQPMAVSKGDKCICNIHTTTNAWIHKEESTKRLAYV